MADLLGVYSGIVGALKTAMIWFIPSLIILVALVVILLVVKQKRMYPFPITILREREDGRTKELETKGGILERRGSAPYFAIRRGWFRSVSIYNLPDLSGMTEGNRLYYYQKNPLTYIQMRRKILAVENPEKKKVLAKKLDELNQMLEYEQIKTTINKKVLDYEPIESDVKYGAVLDIQRINTITQKKSMLDKLLMPLTLFFVLVFVLVIIIVMLDKFNPELMARVAADSRATAEALARAKLAGAATVAGG